MRWIVSVMHDRVFKQEEMCKDAMEKKGVRKNLHHFFELPYKIRFMLLILNIKSTSQ